MSFDENVPKLFQTHFNKYDTYIIKTLQNISKRLYDTIFQVRFLGKIKTFCQLKIKSHQFLQVENNSTSNIRNLCAICALINYIVYNILNFINKRQSIRFRLCRVDVWNLLFVIYYLARATNCEMQNSKGSKSNTFTNVFFVWKMIVF